MTIQGRRNYDAYSAAVGGRSPVTGDQLPAYDDMPANVRHGWDAGADAVEAWLADTPRDQDAAGSEPPKVIIVTAPANGAERRYAANGYTITDGTLFVNLKGDTVAVHAANTWTSFRTGDAIADDHQAKALTTARLALRAIVDNEGASAGEVVQAPSQTALDALNELFDLGYE